MNKENSQALSLKARKESASTQCSNNSYPESALPFRSDKRIRTCRICLEEGNPKNDQNETFIKPCKCSGSLQYVHESCIIQWINLMLEKKKESGEQANAIHCEICKEVLQFKIGKRLVCRKDEDRSRNFKSNRQLFLIGLAMMIFFAACLGGLVYVQMKLVNPSEASYIPILFIVGYVLIGIGFFMWLGKLIWSFLLKIKKQVVHILTKPKIFELKAKPLKQMQARNSNDKLKVQNGGVMVIQNLNEKNKIQRNASMGPLNEHIANLQY